MAGRSSHYRDAPGRQNTRRWHGRASSLPLGSNSHSQIVACWRKLLGGGESRDIRLALPHAALGWTACPFGRRGRRAGATSNRPTVTHPIGVFGVSTCVSVSSRAAAFVFVFGEDRLNHRYFHESRAATWPMREQNRDSPEVLVGESSTALKRDIFAEFTFFAAGRPAVSPFPIRRVNRPQMCGATRIEQHASRRFEPCHVIPQRQSFSCL